MIGEKKKKTKTTPIDRAYLISSGHKPQPAHRPKETRPSKKTLLKLYVEKKFSVRKIAEQLGYSKDLIFRALREYGIDRRKPGKPGKLDGYSLEKLEIKIKSLGYRKAAEDLEVNLSTLVRTMQRKKRKQIDL